MKTNIINFQKKLQSRISLIMMSVFVVLAFVFMLSLSLADSFNSAVPPVAYASTCDCIDQDGDGFCQSIDNCPSTSNPAQDDSNSDGVGNACDCSDSDEDGVCDNVDDCPDDPTNTCGIVVDQCPLIGVQTNDSDCDGRADSNDNCPTTVNYFQTDSDEDGVGDACDSTPNGAPSGGNDGDNCYRVCDKEGTCHSTCDTPVTQCDKDGCQTYWPGEDHDGVGPK